MLKNYQFNIRHLTIMLSLGINVSCRFLHYASGRCGLACAQDINWLSSGYGYTTNYNKCTAFYSLQICPCKNVVIKDNIKIFQVKNYIQRPNRWCNDRHGRLECGTFVYRGFDPHLSQTNDYKISCWSPLSTNLYVSLWSNITETGVWGAQPSRDHRHFKYGNLFYRFNTSRYGLYKCICFILQYKFDSSITTDHTGIFILKRSMKRLMFVVFFTKATTWVGSREVTTVSCQTVVLPAIPRTTAWAFVAVILLKLCL